MPQIIRPETKRIDLGTERVNEPLYIGGRRLFVPFVSSLNATLSVDFNNAYNGTFALTRGVKTKGFGFNVLYLTNTAQPGDFMDLMVFGDPNDPAADGIDFDIPSPASEVQIVGGQGGTGQAVTCDIATMPNVTITGTPNVNLASIAVNAQQFAVMNVDFTGASYHNNFPNLTCDAISFTTTSATYVDAYTVPSGKTFRVGKLGASILGGTGYVRVIDGSSNVKWECGIPYGGIFYDLLYRYYLSSGYKLQVKNTTGNSVWVGGYGYTY